MPEREVPIDKLEYPRGSSCIPLGSAAALREPWIRGRLSRESTI